MKYRQLGKDGPMISVIGFGSWAIGGANWEMSWGEQDDRVSMESVRAALDAGITFFDTAPVYGLGHAEELIGKALGKDRQRVVLATKCGYLWDEERRLVKNGTYASIMREAEASLRRLGTDTIDLYQMHYPDTDAQAPAEETMRAMERLVQDGKVRYIGLCNYNIPLLEQSLAVRHVDSLQPPYSILVPQAERELLPFCLERGIGVVAYSPLASGLLSGKYTYGSTFAETDWRSRHKAYTGEALKRNIDRVEKLKSIAARLDITVAQLAIAYVLAHPALTSAIVGARRPDHVESILPAADVELDQETLAEIRAVAARS
ncbi:aldo/keto reductase [Brevibacillus sp. GCM10020057]|uniref:aldo/keto reductase n=1 Tax=Brevibacillus sp. GCM10020057 TaxID=3317327 RepID=UPI00362BD914